MWYKLKDNTFEFSDYMHFFDGDTDYYCNGIFFIPGFKAGMQSIIEMARMYRQKGAFDFIDYFGAFDFFVKEKDKCTFFTGNGINRCFFYNKEYVSDDMLEIVKNSADVAFDESAVCQYFTYGRIFFDKTYIQDVYMTNSNCYYTVKDGMITRHDKNIGDLSAREKGISPERFSEILTDSLSDVKKVLSLTGGFDSRYVLSMFLKNPELIDTSICGSQTGHADFEISEKVAEKAGVGYSQIYVQKPEVTEEYLVRNFFERNGYFNTLNDGVFRLNEYLQMKKDAGYECLMTGDSGIFHKSDEWPQYFPFYNSPIYSVKRDYRNIILCNRKGLPFSKKFIKHFEDDQKKIIDHLEANRRSINTKNCDWFSWYLSRPASYCPLYNNQSKIIASYPPLLEYRCVIYSYNLPRRKRLMATGMKEYITSVNNEMAAVQTLSGSTTSSEKKYRLKDIAASLMYIVKAAGRLFCRIFMPDASVSHSITDWSCEADIRSLEIAEKAVRFGKSEGWLENNINVENIQYDILLKLIEVFLFKEYREGNISR